MTSSAASKSSAPRLTPAQATIKSPIARISSRTAADKRRARRRPGRAAGAGRRAARLGPFRPRSARARNARLAAWKAALPTPPVVDTGAGVQRVRELAALAKRRSGSRSRHRIAIRPSSGDRPCSQLARILRLVRQHAEHVVRQRRVGETAATPSKPRTGSAPARRRRSVDRSAPNRACSGRSTGSRWSRGHELAEAHVRGAPTRPLHDNQNRHAAKAERGPTRAPAAADPRVRAARADPCAACATMAATQLARRAAPPESPEQVVERDAADALRHHDQQTPSSITSTTGSRLECEAAALRASRRLKRLR